MQFNFSDIINYGKLIAFNTKYEELKKEADFVIDKKDLIEVAKIL